MTAMTALPAAARHNRRDVEGAFHFDKFIAKTSTPSERYRTGTGYATGLRHRLGRPYPAAHRLTPDDGFARGVPLRGVRSGSVLAGLVILVGASGCAPTVAIGSLCSQGAADGGPTPDPDAAVITPWHTGFEGAFCDYVPPMGFCFDTGSGSFQLVTSPVHSGQYAAAFTVMTGSDGGSQVRCVRQGVFPSAAYYGAWYYVPEPATNSGLWNLFHYQGGVPGQTLHGLWDVSLVNLNDGGLHISLFDFLAGETPDASDVPPIPIGRWFHLEVYFRRASDMTGEISMYQDERLAVSLTNLETDDTAWGQWYVGNLATSLAPPGSTVYVDDVTIGPSGPSP